MKSDDFLLLDIQLKNKLYNVQILHPPLSSYIVMLNTTSWLSCRYNGVEKHELESFLVHESFC